MSLVAGLRAPGWTHVPHLSKAGSCRRFQRSLSAYFSILSLASTLVTLKPSSTSMMESTLGRTRDDRQRGAVRGAWEGKEETLCWTLLSPLYPVPSLSPLSSIDLANLFLRTW